MKLRVELMACRGAVTREVRRSEWMERCCACGDEVRSDLVDHPFFGFRAGCDFAEGVEPCAPGRSGFEMGSSSGGPGGKPSESSNMGNG